MTTAPIWLNLGCGEHLAPAPWINLDVVEDETTHPDYVVHPGEPFRMFERADRVYLGHVLEHAPWEPDDLRLSAIEIVEQALRLLPIGGELLIVGPDVLRTIQLYAAGDPCAPWEIVRAVLEGDDEAQYHGAGRDGARHRWNYSQARAIRMLHHVGFRNVEGIEMTDPRLDDWPVVSRAEWQSAVLAIR